MHVEVLSSKLANEPHVVLIATYKLMGNGHAQKPTYRDVPYT